MARDSLLTRQEVEAMCRLSRSAIYRLMREGQFPCPIKIGARAVRWPQSEIESWIADRPRATGTLSERGGPLLSGSLTRSGTS